MPVGSAISSERDLADEFGVSRMTARRAVVELVREGLLERHVGRGTFVARPRVELRLALSSFSEDMRAKGLVPGAVLLGFHSERADAGQRFEQGTPLTVVVRLRTADGVALAMERTRLDARLVPGLTVADVGGSLYETLHDRYDLRFDSGEQRIVATACPADVARELGVDAGVPILRMERLTRARGHLLEQTFSWYRADAYELTAILPGS